MRIWGITDTGLVRCENQDSYATAVGMLKSLISLAMLFTTNAIAKHVRGDAIV